MRTELMLFIILLMGGCSVYQSTPVSLQEATERGNVKVKDPVNGLVYHIDNIDFDSTGYFGLHEQNKFVFTPSDNLKYYLSKDRVYKTWIKLEDKTKVKGILYEVTDTTICVFMGSKLADPLTNLDDELNVEEYCVSDIKIIQLRRVNHVSRLSKNFALGAGVLGIGTGVLAYHDQESELPDAATFILTTFYVCIIGVVYASYGAVIGGSIGVIKKSYLMEQKAVLNRDEKYELLTRAVKK